MIQLGLLTKYPNLRTFSLTPRAVLLGSTVQTGMVRDGRLVRIMDRLAAQTGLEIALFAIAGVNTQSSAGMSVRAQPNLNAVLSTAARKIR
jgi:DNA-binding IclR family transcriptional regulator